MTLAELRVYAAEQLPIQREAGASRDLYVMAITKHGRENGVSELQAARTARYVWDSNAG